MTVDEWMVLWRLMGEPDTLPIEMFLTIPRAAFVKQSKTTAHGSELAEFYDEGGYLVVEWVSPLAAESGDPVGQYFYRASRNLGPQVSPPWQHVGTGNLVQVRAYLKREAERFGLI
jgi:hypothetical protein